MLAVLCIQGGERKKSIKPHAVRFCYSVVDTSLVSNVLKALIRANTASTAAGLVELLGSSESPRIHKCAVSITASSTGHYRMLSTYGEALDISSSDASV